MNRDSQLQRWFDAVGARWRGGELVAPCPLYGDGDSAHRVGGDPVKVVFGVGERKPLLLHCRCCGRERHRDVLAAWGVTDYELQRMAEAAGWGVDGSAAPPPPSYDFDLLHRAYTELLRLCPLTDGDAEWLRRRGVSRELADYCGYGSIPGNGGGRLRATIRDALGLGDGGLYGVPGLNSGDDVRGPGIAIPCRDATGRIRAVKVRLTDGGRVRMRLLSSRRSGGLPAVNDLHHPLPRGSGDSLWITEGERKGDKLADSAATGRVVAVPGVGCVAKAVAHAVESQPRAVYLAFDQDDAGRAAARECVELLRRSSWRGELRTVGWEGAAHKGVDDAIAAGASLSLHEVETASWGAATPPPPAFAATLADALGSQPHRERDFRAAHPRLNGQLTAAIRGGEVEYRRVRGVGGCVAVASLSDEEWSRWTAASNSGAVATRGSGGTASD